MLKTLRGALAEDRTKTFTAEISKLGLVEMTRQNVTEGVREIMSRPCPTCEGEGVIKSEETIAIEVERQLRDIAARSLKRVEAFLVRMNPRVSAQFTGDGARVLHQLEAETGKVFFFEGSEGLPLDHFEVVEEGKADEIAERAVPFAAGDEVKVKIVEPHMYNVDDAVAKIDGYIISRHRRRPAGGRQGARPDRRGGAHVGPRDGHRGARGGARRAPAQTEDDEAVDSKPRRRGRRGGRRRSAAKTAAPTE